MKTNDFLLNAKKQIESNGQEYPSKNQEKIDEILKILKVDENRDIPDTIMEIIDSLEKNEFGIRGTYFTLQDKLLNIFSINDEKSKIKFTPEDFSLNHKNILTFFGKNSRIETVHYIISEEFHPNAKSVYSQLSSVLTFKQKLKILIEVSLALHYLHTRSIPIYDNNFTNASLIFMVGDFENGSLNFTTILPFPGNFSKNKKIDCYFYDFINKNCPGVDVYCFSSFMYQILSEKRPFHDNSLNGNSLSIEISKGLRPNLDFLPSDTPQVLREIILKGWDNNLNVRPDFKNICQQLISLFEQF